MLKNEHCESYLQIATEIKDFVDKYKKVQEMSPLLMSSLIQDTEHWVSELKRLSSEQIQDGIHKGFPDTEY